MDTILLLSQFKKIFLNFYGSGFFFGVKIVLAIYVAVLLVDIILIIVVHTPGMYYRVLKEGANIPTAHKKKIQKKWKKVLERLHSKDDKQHKLAILEADEITNDVLAKIGYPGSNMGERLDGISFNRLETIEGLKGAHEVRNEIVHKADLVLSREKAQEVIEAYQKTLELLEFI